MNTIVNTTKKQPHKRSQTSISLLSFRTKLCTRLSSSMVRNFVKRGEKGKEKASNHQGAKLLSERPRSLKIPSCWVEYFIFLST